MRGQAHWVSLLLTAQTGEKYTAAKLLGEEADETAAREAQAEKDLRALKRKMKRLGF